MTGPRTLAGRLTLVAVVATTLAVGIGTVAFNLILDRALDHNASRQARSLALAAADSVREVRGHLTLDDPAGAESPPRNVWLYEGGQVLTRAVASPRYQAAADRAAEHPGSFVDVAESARLYAAPVPRVDPRGALVAGISLGPYRRVTRLALYASLILAAGLALAVFLIVRATIRRALDPVVAMTRSAAEWSVADLDRRFGAVPRPDELGRLAKTFDDLLGRLAVSLRREQRLSAELSHELRTPLARVAGSLALLRGGDASAEDQSRAFDIAERSAAEMGRVLETLMDAARADADMEHGHSPLAQILAEVRTTWGPVAAGRELRLLVADAPPGSTVAVDADLAERILAPLLDNACRHAATTVRVWPVTDGADPVVVVDDDGAGIAPELAERIFEPGTRGSGDGHRGAGLGLALALRLARAVGGDITAGARAQGSGAELRVRLPR